MCVCPGTLLKNSSNLSGKTLESQLAIVVGASRRSTDYSHISHRSPDNEIAILALDKLPHSPVGLKGYTYE